MTVSRVVNGRGYVGDATRQRVLAAIEALGYVPNQQARSLRSRRSGTIGLIVSDVTNPFFTTVVRGVEDASRGSGSLVLLGNTDEIEAEEVRYMRLLVEKGVDGVLLVPAHHGIDALALAERHRIPVVLIDRRGPTTTDCVRCDSEQGAFELGRHLVDLGHRAFAILAGPDDVSTSDDRISGFRRAIAPYSVEIFHGPLTVESGAELAIAAMHGAPTAIFAVNNFLAIGALNALRRSNVRIPEDVSVVGFDDLPPSMVIFPFLTVTAQPAYELGRRAATRLFDRIARPTLPAEEVILDTNLVIRGSSGPPLLLS